MEYVEAGVEDVVRALGYLTLGSRLKRIGERLQGDTAALLRGFDAALPAGQFPILAALDRLGALSVGDLAQALGVTQPGVTRLVTRLEADGIVESVRSREDRRVRTVRLTETGRQLVERTKHIAWPAIEAAVADACDDLNGPLLRQLAGLEDALAAASLAQRIRVPASAPREGPVLNPPSLDRPVWSSLCTHHEGLSVGDARARRYAPDVNLFAAARDDSAESAAALGALVRPGETVFVLQARPIRVPDGLTVVKQAKAVQMVATQSLAETERPAFEILSEKDTPEMVALTRLTEPGPFLARTRTMGRFIGMRIDGRLAAMAGERMRLPGFTEVSGVCTHPDFRGRGLARSLSTAVAAHIAARHETPFLHAWKDNVAAIQLYEGLGFRLRTEMHVAVLTRS